MAFNGPRATFETTAASTSEQKIATTEEKRCLLQSGRQFVAQKNGRDTDPNAAKGLPVEFQPDAHVIDRSGTVEQAQLAAETGVAQHAQRSALGNRLAVQGRDWCRESPPRSDR